MPFCSGVSYRVPAPTQTPSETVSTDDIRSLTTVNPLGSTVVSISNSGPLSTLG